MWETPPSPRRPCGGGGSSAPDRLWDAPGLKHKVQALRTNDVLFRVVKNQLGS